MWEANVYTFEEPVRLHVAFVVWCGGTDGGPRHSRKKGVRRCVGSMVSNSFGARGDVNDLVDDGRRRYGAQSANTSGPRRYRWQ
eukprot:scaffold3261_cov69-Cyclotella_meneghiniana.AAC.2